MRIIQDIPLHRYRVIVVDPPWNRRKTGYRQVRPLQGTILDYPVMAKIKKSLPLFLWEIGQRLNAFYGFGQPIARIGKRENLCLSWLLN